jgi:TPR repeat protein
VVVATTAPNAETPTRPTTPVEFRLTAEEAAALLARGDRLLSIGDVTSARLFYERAADGGAGLAALRLGETYDPVFLDRVHLRGVRADLGAASSWYRRARDLGTADAEVLLRGLETK